MSTDLLPTWHFRSNLDKTNAQKPAGTRHSTAHMDWFKIMYDKGIKHARQSLIDYSRELTKDPNVFSNLEDGARTRIQAISGLDASSAVGWDEICKNTLDYPTEGIE